MRRAWTACVAIIVLASLASGIADSSRPAAAQQPPTAATAAPPPAATEPTEPAEAEAAAPVVDSEEARKQRAEAIELLQPLVDAIAAAQQTRATIELTSRSLVQGQAVASEQAIYQIASQQPNRYNIQLKGGDQVLQIVCDGELSSVVLGGAGYFQVAAPATLQDVVPALPLPLGPYPEPLLALSLAGADLPGAMIRDMASLVVENREPYDGVPAAQIRGVQADGVSWSLWIATTADQPRPLRLNVDLTKVVVGDGIAGLPEGFAFELDARFTQWRVDAQLEDRVFQYAAPADLPQFESLDALIASLQMPVGTDHPLVGQAAPVIESTLLSGEPFRLSDLQGKVVMIDFWATWCGPCIEAMPVIAEVGRALADRGVVTYALNIGESNEEIEAFLAEQSVDLPVVVDPTSAIADRFHAEAIPQTVLIDQQGRVAFVHVGFGELEEFRQQLTDQLTELLEAPAEELR